MQCTGPIRIGVEMFRVYVHGPIDENTDRMAMLACSYFKTLCPILSSLLCLPQVARAEFPACRWHGRSHLAIRAERGGVCKTRSLHKRLEPDPQLEMKSTSLGSAGSWLRFNVQLLRKECIYFLNHVYTLWGIRLSF